MKENKKLKNPKGTYRPTVRYHSMFRTYIDSLFQATSLDRNQIMRCALFTAAHNPIFLEIMKEYKLSDVPLPSPLWTHSTHQLWLEQEPLLEEKGGVECDHIDRKRTSSNTSKISGTSRVSRSMPRTTFSSKQQPSSSEKKEQQNRRQQPIERRTRALPAVQLSNNGGIRIDLR
ncbi:hypothetical protein NLI92_002873 [Priestia megaterium]|uniref:hypothetical protein n=1 Tax=Priestia megaterium TaxID=1404 RepID=UPI0021AD2466|nr:hypothetical protein [Priestia megaterium]MCR8927484.1 hypothetical protein [Priestia megaterium]